MARILTKILIVGVCYANGASISAQPARPVAEATSPAGIERFIPESNPAVLAALELPRTEPQHYLSAVLALAKLKHAELAAPILKELVELNLTQEQQADLVRDFGTARFLELARVTELAPTAQEFADACLTAAAERDRDPQRLTKLIEDLQSPSAATRNAARVDLATSGEPAVVATLEAFANENDPQRRQAIAAAIVSMNPAAVDPLLGMVSTTDRTLRSDVIRVLKTMQVTLAKPFIAGEKSTASAERLLDEAIGRNKRGVRWFATDENGEAAIWQWDDATKKLTAARYPIDDAQTVWAARLAMEYAQLRPEDRLARCQALVLGLEAAAITGDRASPAIEKLLAEADGDMLGMVLQAATQHHMIASAVAAAEALGKQGDVAVLYAASPNPAPLARALEYPNRRVRFAALGAIMALDPPASFPGASRVPETLGYFATGAAERRAVVAMPVANHATTLAGRLATAGVDAEPATRGGNAVALARRSADLEMMLVDMDIDGPGVRDVIYAVRTNAATGQVPIGLVATGDRLDAARNLAEEHQRVVAFPRPQTDEALAELISRLKSVSGRNPVSAQDRAETAGQALSWLGQLLARDETFYDLRRQAPVVEAALYLPAMSEKAVQALALMGTPASQRSLIGFASHLTTPIEQRQLAAEAFAESVGRHGILLTESEILRQYDRYNASASLDADTQQVLGRLLDAIESLRAQADARSYR
jgi:HEAT repeat protein